MKQDGNDVGTNIEPDNNKAFWNKYFKGNNGIKFSKKLL